MNENDFQDQMFDAGNEFWQKFARLVAETVSKFPREYESQVLERLQEKCSVYGCDYHQYVKRS